MTTETTICKWFLLCENEATTTRSHPILGDVPICKRCDDKIAAIERPSNDNKEVKA